MKNNFSSAFFLFFVAPLFAQPTIQWQKTLGGSELEEVRSVKQTNDGGYIAAGVTTSYDGDVVGNHGGRDMWVVKFTETGAVEWKKAYGGTGVEWPYAIQQTPEGGYIVAGYADSNNGDVTGNHGGKDAWVVKLSSTGAIEWQKSLGGSGWDEAWAIQLTSDGGYILAGRSNSLDGDVTGNHGGLDYWVVKLNNLGAIEWQRSLGGTKEDNGYAVRQTMDGGYIVAGESLSTNGDITGNHGDADYCVVKLGPMGNLEWQKSFGGTGLDRANVVVQANDGGYVVIGQASSNIGDITHPHGGYDIWVVKMDSFGILEWEKSFGGSDQDWGSAVQLTIDGGYVIGGSTWSNDGDAIGNDGITDMWVVKLSGSGTLQWQKSLGGSLGEDGFAIQQTYDGGYILGGKTWSNDGDLTEHIGKSDFWVVKLSPASVGVQDLPAFHTAAHLEAFPNPAHQAISISIPDNNSTISVSISDLLGKQILRQNIQNSGVIDVSSFANGMYLVVATDYLGKVYSSKIWKE